MTTPHYELLCCALNAAEEALAAKGIPVPEIRGVIAHDPMLDCSCDALFVQIGDSRSTIDQRTPSISDSDGGGFQPGACDIPFRVTEVIVSLTRCVHLKNPLTDDCWPAGDCRDAIGCPGDVPLVRSADQCGEAAPSKSVETAWLMEDRWALEWELPRLWAKCLCAGWCAGGCENSPEWPQVGCHSVPRWVSSEPVDSGGCGGTRAVYEIHTP